jgi:outer membrane protein OmpA-like peptidoglycan-associated protein
MQSMRAACLMLLCGSLAACMPKPHAPAEATPDAPKAATAPAPARVEPKAAEAPVSTKTMLPPRTGPKPVRKPTPEVEVVVLPEADGKVGTVLVENENGTTTLNTAFQSARVATDGTVRSSNLEGNRVREAFAPALAAMPERPASYTVWFPEGQDEPTAESRKELKKILEAIRQRPAPDVTVIGHADAVGRESRNDKLSLQRARKIRTALIKLGIPADHINAAGRGAREPLFPSEKPGKAEPRNRRVEISVR